MEGSASHPQEVAPAEAQTCAICLESLLLEETASESTSAPTEEGEQSSGEQHILPYYQIRCGHITHSHCLQRSIRSGNYTCPLCRQSLGDIDNVLTATETRLRRYVKMLKSGLVASAVRQRMIVDGLPMTVVDAFFTGGASRALQSNAAANPDGSEENTAESTAAKEKQIADLLAKYRKMLDMGLPEGAVRQKVRATTGLSAVEVQALEQAIFS